MTSSARLSLTEPETLTTSLRTELERLAADPNAPELCFAEVALSARRLTEPRHALAHSGRPPSPRNAVFHGVPRGTVLARCTV